MPIRPSAIRVASRWFQADDDNVPTNPGLWEKIQKLTAGEIKSITHDGEKIDGPNEGKGFEVHPSAYSNGWASALYDRLGGGWKKGKKKD